ncbi:hypothetical protein ACTXT7_007021 [Hymenolepis weldensis]
MELTPTSYSSIYQICQLVDKPLQDSPNILPLEKFNTTAEFKIIGIYKMSINKDISLRFPEIIFVNLVKYIGVTTLQSSLPLDLS